MKAKPAFLTLLVVASSSCSPPATTDTTPPAWPAGAVLSASSVTLASATLSWPTAIDPPGAMPSPPPLRYRLLRDGALVTQTTSLSAQVTGLQLGEGHVFKVEAGDPADNWTTNGPEADVAGAPTAPSAPPLDSTVATNVCEATRFLYTGPNAIQQGVTPGSLRCAAVALMRGKVSSVTGEGLGAVRVTIQGHPEWGFTFTQGDGQFDFVVEGGQHTIDFLRSGHFPAQRVAMLRAGQWGHAPPVSLLKRDKRVSELSPMAGGAAHVDAAERQGRHSKHLALLSARHPDVAALRRRWYPGHLHRARAGH